MNAWNPHKIPRTNIKEFLLFVAVWSMDESYVILTLSSFYSKAREEKEPFSNIDIKDEYRFESMLNKGI